MALKGNESEKILEQNFKELEKKEIPVGKYFFAKKFGKSEKIPAFPKGGKISLKKYETAEKKLGEKPFLFLKEYDGSLEMDIEVNEVFVRII